MYKSYSSPSYGKCADYIINIIIVVVMITQLVAQHMSIKINR